MAEWTDRAAPAMRYLRSRVAAITQYPRPDAIDSSGQDADIHASASISRCISIRLGTRHDRSLLLDHAERPQDHDVSRRGRAEIQDFPGQYRQGRSVQAGVFGDRAEQPHSRDIRSRAKGG